MRTRTQLTTPPGQEPELSASSGPAGETYVPGMALPQEPTVPGRHRRLVVTLVTVVLLAVIGYGAFRAMTAGQTFDPALDPGFTPTESATDPSPGLPSEG